MATGKLLPALALASQLEPYKKLLGILVRQDCVSVAISNPYLNLAEPLGAVMLRGGRLPARSFTRLLAGQEQQLAGFLIGYEVKQGSGEQQQQQHQQPQPLTAQQEAAVQQLRVLLSGLVPASPGAWYGSWAAEAASCRIMPPSGPSAAAAAAAGSRGQPSGAPPQPQQQEQVQPQGGAPLVAAALAGGAGQPGQQQQQPLCSLGQQFLQDYLDSLGALNTFG